MKTLIEWSEPDGRLWAEEDDLLVSGSRFVMILMAPWTSLQGGRTSLGDGSLWLRYTGLKKASL